MIKWFKLNKNYYLGFFPLGIVFILLQLFPYLFLPTLEFDISRLTTYSINFSWLGNLEKAIGAASILALIFIIPKARKRPGVTLEHAFILLTIYYLGWFLYVQLNLTSPFLLFFLFILPSIYYALIGFWRNNFLLVFLTIPLLLIHTINFSVNLT